MSPPRKLPQGAGSLSLALDLRSPRSPRDKPPARANSRLCAARVRTEPESLPESLWRATCLDHHRRACGAIEGFDAALRPRHHVRKGATRGSPELFRLPHNPRIRLWGRHRGTSAHRCLPGRQVTGWLAFLGCPPSSSIR